MAHDQSINTGKMEESKKRAKWCSIFCTFLYLILLPFFLLISLGSGMIFDKPSMPTPLGLWIMFMLFCVPFSMVVSIFMIWRNYLIANFKKAYIYCMLPFLCALLAFVLNAVLQTIFCL